MVFILYKTAIILSYNNSVVIAGLTRNPHYLLEIAGQARNDVRSYFDSGLVLEIQVEYINSRFDTFFTKFYSRFETKSNILTPDLVHFIQNYTPDLKQNQIFLLQIWYIFYKNLLPI